MEVDHVVVSFFSQPGSNGKKVFDLALLLIPGKYILQKRMLCEKRFISFSYQQIDLCAGVMSMKLLGHRSCKNGIADKGRLYDEEFQTLLLFLAEAQSPQSFLVSIFLYAFSTPF